jgi:NAD(P)-dependent dehydrogenase (short-subunit alcohol dehydrogenase family)
MDLGLQDRVALATGSARGIGKAIATKFAKQGASVHILDSNTDAGMQTVEELRAKDLTVTGHTCDVADQKQVQDIVNGIAAVQGIDILVNNAGIAHVGNIEGTEEEDLDRLYQVNIKGVYNGMFACIPHMKKKGNGVILNMASIASSVGIYDRFAYSMTKGAVLTMTLSVAKDYVAAGIRCNSISPARVHTPFVDGFLAENYPGKEQEIYEKLAKTQPIERMAKPEEVADLALFLCSDEAAFITGTDYPIDGGFIKLNGK